MKRMIFTGMLLGIFFLNSFADELDRSAWILSASHESGENGNVYAMIDGSPDTFWTAGDDMQPGQWVVVNFGSPQTFNRMFIEQGVKGGDYSRTFEVYVSDDGEEWGNPVLTGIGEPNETTVNFPEVQRGQYVKLQNTYANTGGTIWWAIAEWHILLMNDYRSEWVITASASDGKTGDAIDGDPDTRWDSDDFQSPGQWIAVDMQEPQTFNQIVLDGKNDYPAAYAVFVSDDPENFGNPIASGEGTPVRTVINLPSEQTARYLKVEQTGTRDDAFWSVYELNIRTADYRANWTMTASSGEDTFYALDGDANTEWNSGTAQSPGQWILVDMKESQPVNRIVLQSKSPSEYLLAYKVYVSDDGINFGEAVTGGNGSQILQIDLHPRQNGRFLKIEQTESGDNNWSVGELNILFINDYRFDWEVTASPPENAGNMIDGDPTSRWNTIFQTGDGSEWFVVDMQEVQRLSSITLEQEGKESDFPAGYALYLSNDGETWGIPLITGQGTYGLQTEIVLPGDREARYFKVEQTGRSTVNYWHVGEVHASLLPTAIPEIKAATAKITYDNGQLWLDNIDAPATVTVYSLSGQILHSSLYNRQSIPVVLNQGVYIVTAKDGNRVYNQKIIVK